MKFEKQTTDIVKMGQSNSKQATISEHKISKLQYILTRGLYSDPVTAVIAEITNNGVDAVAQAGKDPKEHPVLVEIDKNSQGNYFFRVTDKGLGLIPWEFRNVLMNYLESTKEDDDSAIGYFGLGSKSFLSLERPATFTCRRKGAEWKFIAYQGQEFCEYDMVSKQRTTEEDGLTFEIAITSYTEAREFVQKAKQKLAYYDTVALMVFGQLVKNNITRSEDWQYSSENSSSSLHLCLKDVYYIIDFQKLGIKPINIPIALRFGLKDGLVVTPSRESLIYTEKVKGIILEKIQKVANWFVDRYNKETDKEFDSIMEVWDQLDKTDKIVEINSVQFTINSLSVHATSVPNEIRIKGIKYQNPVWYKYNKHFFLSNYNNTLYKKAYGKFKPQKSYLKSNIASSILINEKVLIINKMPLGYPRQYLTNKYESNTCIVAEKVSDRQLRLRVPFGHIIDDSISYYHLLKLMNFPKNQWRGRIIEFQRVEKEFADKLCHETDIENTKEFQDWLVQHKAFLKANKSPSASNYKGLNKQDGDMTIAVARASCIDRDFIVFEKKVFKISELYKQEYLFVLFDTKEEAEKQWKVLRGCNNIKLCMIGKREITKLPLFKSKKFIKFEEFMETKPFQRIASSILFNRVVNDFEAIESGRKDIFVQFLSSYLSDTEQLKQYIDVNYQEPADVTVEDAILEIAKEHNLFDQQLWDVFLRVKEAVKRFEFLTCLKSPNSWEIEERKKYKRLINQMLLFQKKYYDLEGYELVKKSDTPPAPKVVDEEAEDEFEEEEELEFA